MSKSFGLRLVLAAVLALVALFLGPILAFTPWFSAVLLFLAVILIATGWRRLVRRK